MGELYKQILLTIIALATVTIAVERVWRGGAAEYSRDIPQAVYFTNEQPLKVDANAGGLVAVKIERGLDFPSSMNVRVLNNSLDVAVPGGVTANIINPELTVRIKERFPSLR